MPEDSLRVVARIKALPDKVDMVRSILLELIEPTRREEGCIVYELLQNKADPTDFTFVEEWKGESSLTAMQTANISGAHGRSLRIWLLGRRIFAVIW